MIDGSLKDNENFNQSLLEAKPNAHVLDNVARLPVEIHVSAEMFKIKRGTE